MIRYALVCRNGDEFEGWFRSSDDYEAQEPSLDCPVCGIVGVRRAPMAPAIIGRRGEQPSPQALAAKLREHVREHFNYVGERFPEEVRAIQRGESEERPLWGEASLEEARALIEEGAPVAPLPPAITPTPPKKLN